MAKKHAIGNELNFYWRKERTPTYNLYTSSLLSNKPLYISNSRITSPLLSVCLYDNLLLCVIQIVIQMANNLTARTCETLKCPSNKNMVNHYDGGGLYFRITPNKKSWLFQFTLNGKRNLMSIGSYDVYSLVDARKQRDVLRELVAKGLDPRIEKHKSKFTAAADSELTFEKAYTETLNNKIIPNSSEKHVRRWVETYNKYLKNPLAKLPLKDIDDTILLEVLENIYKAAPSSTMKTKSQINVIYTYVKEKKWFKGANPVNELKGNSLIAPPKTKHHKHLEEHRVGELLKALEQSPNLITKTFLYVVMVTALRSGSLSNARWSWIDSQTNTLNIPSEHMKSRNSFRCPLPTQAAEGLNTLKKITGGNPSDYIFVGRNDKPISDATARMALQKILKDKTTVHGFRTLFNRVVSKMNKFDTEKIEAQLTHAFTATDIRKTYLGGEDYLDDRRIIVQAYADWCDKQYSI